MSEQVFRLPDVGEGLTEADILTWHVKVGDQVVVNQTIVEIETAKAAVELPCPFDGVVTALHVAVGDVVAVGDPILTIGTAGAEPTGPAPGDQSAAAPQHDPSPDLVPAVPGTPAAAAGEPKREAVLVGYGVRDTGTPARRSRVTAASPHGAAAPEAGPPGEVAKPVRHGGLEVGRHAEEVLSRQSPVLAKPPVRKLARDLGVDLAAVSPTGGNGVITRADVERTARAGQDPGRGPSRPRSGERSSLPREERIPVRGVLRSMAEAMVRSAFTAPHVTEWVQVDVTRSMRLLARLRAEPELAEVKVSPLLLVAAGLVRAVRRHPRVNATWDEAAGEVVVKHYVNLGIAAATPRGLLVPNVKEAQDLSLPELADALTGLVRTAREGRTSPADLTGGTITITNVGVFGVDGGTPIINPGEAAILAMGQVAERPWVHNGRVRPRQVMELTLSFDHRLVDGALGSQVLADVAAFLRDPELSLALS
jgi:pyruvate dehydrogenase E2 component (dihydrolipoamide acetyltransferase)